ncbi:MAG: ArsA family ATPase [Oligoflexus sp.]
MDPAGGTVALGAFDELLAKKLVLVTGKGGIGKSLMAASLAQKAASEGQNVCMVESSAQDQLAPLFGYPPVGHKLSLLRPNISVINLNPQDNFRDFVVLHLGFARLFEKVFTKPIVRSFIQMLPGIAELTLLGRLYHLCEEKKDFDLVVLDGFASGHFLSLLKTPDAVMNSGMVGPVIEETRKVREFIFDGSKVATMLVTTPEELVISEALDFSQRLFNEVPSSVSHIAVNRCLSVKQQILPSEEEAEEEGIGFALGYLRRRILSERKNLQNLRDGLSKIYTQSQELAPRLSLLPDRGAIDEPLPPGFAKHWFAEAQELT